MCRRLTFVTAHGGAAYVLALSEQQPDVPAQVTVSILASCMCPVGWHAPEPFDNTLWHQGILA